jgi:uncharacterized protein YaaQ
VIWKQLCKRQQSQSTYKSNSGDYELQKEMLNMAHKKTNDGTFIFGCNTELLDQARKLATDNCMSLAAFVRQSIYRNIMTYGRDQ